MPPFGILANHKIKMCHNSMKKIMIQKITQNNGNFWTVNLIMRANIVNQSSDFPVRRTGLYRHKKSTGIFPYFLLTAVSSANRFFATRAKLVSMFFLDFVNKSSLMSTSVTSCLVWAATWQPCTQHNHMLMLTTTTISTTVPQIIADIKFRGPTDDTRLPEDPQSTSRSPPYILHWADCNKKWK